MKLYLSFLWNLHRPLLPSRPFLDKHMGEILGYRKQWSKKVVEFCKKFIDICINIDLPFVLNISGILIEQLENENPNLLKDLKKLFKKKKFEILGTSYFNALLPFLPEEDVKEQINFHLEKINDFKPKGFFFPELVYDPWLIDSIIENKFEWILASDEWLKIDLMNYKEEILFKPCYFWGIKGNYIKTVLVNKNLSSLLQNFSEENKEKILSELERILNLYGNENPIIIFLINTKDINIEILNSYELFFKEIKEINNFKPILISDYLEKFPIEAKEENIFYISPHSLEGDCSLKIWSRLDEQKILFKLIDYARDEINLSKGLVMNKAGENLLERAKRELFLAESADWFDYKKNAYKFLLGRGHALNAFRLAKAIQKL